MESIQVTQKIEQIVFLNRRNIKNPIITNAADQAFKGATGIGKFGFFILNIEMPADYYLYSNHKAVYTREQ